MYGYVMVKMCDCRCDDNDNGVVHGTKSIVFFAREFSKVSNVIPIINNKL